MKVGVFGSAADASADAEILAGKLGEALANNGCTIITGAGHGLPHVASLAALNKGAKTIGFSPAKDLVSHEYEHNLPTDAVGEWVFTPEKYAKDLSIGIKFRNVMSCAACDAGIIIGGRIGTLNEFTNLYDMGKIIGVLEGSGGSTLYLRQIIEVADKKNSAIIIFESDPKMLVQKILEAKR